jgi:flavodoxin
MKLLVVYDSRHGSTQQYAEWLHEQMGGKLMSVKDVTQDALAKSDVLVFGGYVHAGKISIRNVMRKHWPIIEGKPVVLFTTSGTPPTETGTIQAVFEGSFPPEIRERLTFFPLWGRIDKAQWKLADRALVRIGSWIEKDPDVKRGMVSDFDGVRKEALEPLVKHIRSLLTKQDKE